MVDILGERFMEYSALVIYPHECISGDSLLNLICVAIHALFSVGGWMQ